jgi:hypothetical protein
LSIRGRNTGGRDGKNVDKNVEWMEKVSGEQ